MFKTLLKVSIISFLILNLSLTIEDPSKYYDDLPLIKNATEKEKISVEQELNLDDPSLSEEFLRGYDEYVKHLAGQSNIDDDPIVEEEILKDYSEYIQRSTEQANLDNESCKNPLNLLEPSDFFPPIHKQIAQKEIDNLIIKLKKDDKLNFESKFSILLNLSTFIIAFGVKENELPKFRIAMQTYDFKSVLECLDFNLAEKLSIDQEIATPKLLNSTIEILEEKIKQLKDSKIFFDIMIGINEICANYKDDKQKNDLTKDLWLFIENYEKIKNKELLLEKIKNKDWQGALNLAKDLKE